MVKILHPLTEQASQNLRKDYPAIARALGKKARASKYPHQIHRLLAAQYDPGARGISRDLALIESACNQREPASANALKVSDGYTFQTILSELRAWRYLLSRGLKARTLEQGTSLPDILVTDMEPTMAIEVYSPSRPLSVALIDILFRDKLKYLAEAEGYQLRVRLGPVKEHPFDFYWPEHLCDVNAYRDWEASFLDAAVAWLPGKTKGDEQTFAGPGDSVVVKLSVTGLVPECSCIGWSSASHSVDWHSYFERSSAINMSQGAFGAKIRQKLGDGQAARIEAGVRLLLVDLSHLDSAFPPNMSEAAQRTIGQIFELVGSEQTNYDGCLAIDFANVDTIGPLVWFGRTKSSYQEIVQKALGFGEPLQ